MENVEIPQINFKLLWYPPSPSPPPKKKIEIKGKKVKIYRKVFSMAISQLTGTRSPAAINNPLGLAKVKGKNIERKEEWRGVQVLH